MARERHAINTCVAHAFAHAVALAVASAAVLVMLLQFVANSTRSLHVLVHIRCVSSCASAAFFANNELASLQTARNC